VGGLLVVFGDPTIVVVDQRLDLQVVHIIREGLITHSPIVIVV
jgi:hypothetical protein